MPKHTSRDVVWNFVVLAVCRNWIFKIDDVRQEIPVERDVSNQTIQNVLNTAVDQGYLKKKEQPSTWSADTSLRNEMLRQ